MKTKKKAESKQFKENRFMNQIRDIIKDYAFGDKCDSIKDYEIPYDYRSKAAIALEKEFEFRIYNPFSLRTVKDFAEEVRKDKRIKSLACEIGLLGMKTGQVRFWIMDWSSPSDSIDIDRNIEENGGRRFKELVLVKFKISKKNKELRRQILEASTIRQIAELMVDGI